MSDRKQVFIIQAGEWGGLSRSEGAYEEYEQRIHSAAVVAERSPSSGEKLVDVEMVASAEDALSKIRGQDSDVILVFTTRG